jgi:hypothetical protein
LTTLEERSATFAQEVRDTLVGVLPGDHKMISVRLEGESERYVVRPPGDEAKHWRVPVFVGGEQLAALSVVIYLALDRTGTYLKTVRSDVAVHSTLDRMALLRLEYRADMHTEPIAHWQMHAERGAFSHLLGRANAVRPEQVHKPHDLSSLHLPVGGERFRPCLEDVLQFLVVDCGVDAHDGWQAVVEAGRERWRLRQLGSAVRDAPGKAADVLTELGWTVTPPDLSLVPPKAGALTKW